MKIDALMARSGEWRLLRAISGLHLATLEAAGWTCRATWTESPSVATVLVAARRR